MLNNDLIKYWFDRTDDRPLDAPVLPVILRCKICAYEIENRWNGVFEMHAEQHIETHRRGGDWVPIPCHKCGRTTDLHDFPGSNGKMKTTTCHGCWKDSANCICLPLPAQQ